MMVFLVVNYIWLVTGTMEFTIFLVGVCYPSIYYHPVVGYNTHIWNLVGGDWNHGILNDFPIILGME